MQVITVVSNFSRFILSIAIVSQSDLLAMIWHQAMYSQCDTHNVTQVSDCRWYVKWMKCIFFVLELTWLGHSDCHKRDTVAAFYTFSLQCRTRHLYALCQSSHSWIVEECVPALLWVAKPLSMFCRCTAASWWWSWSNQCGKLATVAECTLHVESLSKSWQYCSPCLICLPFKCWDRAPIVFHTRKWLTFV